MIERKNIFPIILAGGFGVRTEGVLEGRPKALIRSSDGKTLLEHLLLDLEDSGFDSALLVTNGRFYDSFTHHLEELGKKGLNIKVDFVNNRINDSEKRLGALGDLLLGIESRGLKDWGGSFLVLSSDYAYWKAFKIEDFVQFSQESRNKNLFLTIVRDTRDPEIVKRRFGCPVLDNKGLVVSFEEKPESPKSTLAILAFYLFRPDHVNLLKEFKDVGGNLDSLSNIIPFLLQRGIEVSVFIVNDNVIDAGTPEEINRAQNY